MLGRNALERALREYRLHYLRERNHQGLGNRLLDDIPQDGVNRQQQDVIDYLREENRVLRAGLRGKRLRLSDDDRPRLWAGRRWPRLRPLPHPLRFCAGTATSSQPSTMAARTGAQADLRQRRTSVSSLYAWRRRTRRGDIRACGAHSRTSNTDTKLLIYGRFQKGRVLAQDGVLTISPVGLSPTEHASLSWTRSCPKTRTNSRPASAGAFRIDASRLCSPIASHHPGARGHVRISGYCCTIAHAMKRARSTSALHARAGSRRGARADHPEHHSRMDRVWTR